MTSFVNVDDLLKNIEKPLVNENTETLPSINNYRLLHFICNDVIRAYCDTNKNDSINKIKSLQKELRSNKVLPKSTSFVLPSNASPDLKKLFQIETERMNETNRLAEKCMSAIKTMKNTVDTVRTTTSKWLTEKKKLIEKKVTNWNKKADNIARKQLKTVINNQKIVEKDWAKIVKTNNNFETLRGGSATHRLELANDLGYEASESCFARAKKYDTSKNIHETVHWRLRDTVESVSNNILEKAINENEKTVQQTISNAAAKGQEEIQEALIAYKLKDTTLKYESEMLQSQLKKQGISTNAILHQIINQLEHFNKKHRLMLAKTI